MTLERAEDALQRRALRYDRAGDQHYDTISAWIKATRGSDPDASLYYLAVMLEGGEDARFIARRMVILASEDVGNADPQALVVAAAAARRRARRDARGACTRSPRPPSTSRLAPKSNAAYRAIAAAREHVRDPRREGAAAGRCRPPRATSARAELGRGRDYDYPHDHPGHVSEQELMPDALVGERFYEPDDAEAAMRDRLSQIRRARGRLGLVTGANGAPATLDGC